VLRQRAARAHQSLQEYLLELLVTHAAEPTVGEVLDRVEGRSGGAVTFELAAELIRHDRAGR